MSIFCVNLQIDAGYWGRSEIVQGGLTIGRGFCTLQTIINLTLYKTSEASKTSEDLTELIDNFLNP
jgi:hypothetical protein